MGWMTFFEFAITFRHEHVRNRQREVRNHALESEQMYFFANQIVRDKKYPRNSSNYLEIKNYVIEHFREDIVNGFEIIWKMYESAKKQNTDEAHIEVIDHNE